MSETAQPATSSEDGFTSKDLIYAGDFILFRKEQLHRETPEHQKEIFELIDGNQCSVAMVARQFGKSTLLRDYLIWILRFHREFKEIIIVSASYVHQSKGILEKITDEIRDNDYLKDLVPSSRTAPDNRQEFTTRWGTKVQIMTFSDTARGASPDMILFDDILVSQDITQSKIKDRFWSIFYPMVSITGGPPPYGRNTGKIVFIGTPIGMDNLLTNIIRDAQKDKEEGRKPEWATMTFPGAVIEDRKIVSSKWPEQVPVPKLEMMRRQMGDIRFYQEVMCDPLAHEDALFPYDTHIVPNLKVNQYLTQHQPNCVYYLGADIALSKDQKADYSVFTIVEVDTDGHSNLVKLERYKGKSIEEQIDQICILDKTFNFKKITVEQRGLSYGMVDDMANPELYPQIFNRVEGFKTTYQNKTTALGRLAYYLGAGILSLPKTKLPYAEQLVEELKGFAVIEKEVPEGHKTVYECASAHDDCVMSLAICMMGKAEDEIGSASFGIVSF